jgi:hypothetical protein
VVRLAGAIRDAAPGRVALSEPKHLVDSIILERRIHMGDGDCEAR